MLSLKSMQQARRFVAAGLAKPPQLGGAGDPVSREALWALLMHMCTKKKKKKASLNTEPFKMIKDPMQVIVLSLESCNCRMQSLVII